MLTTGILFNAERIQRAGSNQTIPEVKSHDTRFKLNLIQLKYYSINSETVALPQTTSTHFPRKRTPSCDLPSKRSRSRHQPQWPRTRSRKWSDITCKKKSYIRPRLRIFFISEDCGIRFGVYFTKNFDTKT
jgi:hypothetical protein